MTKAASLPLEIAQIFEAIPDAYLILSPDLTILTASKAYLKVTDKELEKIKGRYLFDVFPDNPTLATTNATSKLRQSLEWVLKHKQAHKMPLHRYDIQHPTIPDIYTEKYWRPSNIPVLDEDGNITFIIHKVIDATHTVLVKQREKSLDQRLKQLTEVKTPATEEIMAARAEAEMELMRLNNLLMQAPAMICIFEGPQHVFKFVNPPYQKLVGDRPLLGKPIAEAMPELEGQPIFGLLDNVYRTGESVYAYEMLVQLDHANSGELGNKYYNFTYQATYSLNGEIEGIMVFAYEVTPQVLARQQLEDQRFSLQQLNEQLVIANRETQEANEELFQTQIALQELNQELEKRVADRTKELQLSKAETETQRNLLHTIFLNAPTPFVILEGPDHFFKLVNPSFQQIFPGRTLENKSLLEALPELGNTPIPEILDNVYRTGEHYEAREFPLMLARHQGDPPEEIFFTFTYQPHLNEHNAIDGVLVFVHDVTEGVRARQVVERSAEQLQLITDALPVLISYLDKEEKYRFANKAYETWFPMKSKDLLGKTVCEVVGQEAYQQIKGYIDRALSGERLNFQSRMPYRKDFVKYIQTSYIPDFRDGDVVGFYTLVNDVTEQVESRMKIEEREREAQALTKKLAATNEELIITNEQLVRTNIDLDNFIYTASHDLKAPINNIEGLVKILTESIPAEAAASEEMVHVISMIEDSISRFKRTIEHLTEITKLQKENNQEATVVELANVINDVKLDLEPQVKAANAKLSINVEPCPAIHFSKKNLRSVVYNLLSNAIKYNSPNRTPEIHLSCYQKGPYVVLSVMDNGLGMSELGRQKLFSMFGRLHDHVEGSGIGLYMVKKIVENADGHIEVESEPNVGSTFKVYLKI
ncbi:PAS domain-containing protein [Pontibacter cellulosilyticus]|uniref:histidine kinase n=1 Tax=Pontibacter cellulosilyticus TaxID=1720253 RepID=A0A923N578_9BACT|nr:PAS domain-containing protein [Pontibacter cellulosilyticus]MBC5991962.1 PAS domain-containing protein [Pontibacter cellulosilyticus]